VTIQEIIKKIETWDSYLTVRQKRYIHFKSLRNFAFHFDNLPNERTKEIALDYLNQYIEEVQINNATLTSSESYHLATNIMNKIADIYSTHLNFKSILELRFVILFSLIGDTILYFLLKGKLPFFIPLISIILLTYYFSRKLTLEKKRLLFGLFY
jgi:hypothetical protein